MNMIMVLYTLQTIDRSEEGRGVCVSSGKGGVEEAGLLAVGERRRVVYVDQSRMHRRGIYQNSLLSTTHTEETQTMKKVGR